MANYKIKNSKSMLTVNIMLCWWQEQIVQYFLKLNTNIGLSNKQKVGTWDTAHDDIINKQNEENIQKNITDKNNLCGSSLTDLKPLYVDQLLVC